MADPIITNVDIGNILVRNAEFADDIFEFTGAATILEGTILARDSVTEKLIPFVKGGATNDNGIPKAIISYQISATGAVASFAIRALISGTVRKERLVIDADGDDSNIDSVVRDQLRDYAQIALDVQELGILDNQ